MADRPMRRCTGKPHSCHTESPKIKILSRPDNALAQGAVCVGHGSPLRTTSDVCSWPQQATRAARSSESIGPQLRSSKEQDLLVATSAADGMTERSAGRMARRNVQCSHPARRSSLLPDFPQWQCDPGRSGKCPLLDCRSSECRRDVMPDATSCCNASRACESVSCGRYGADLGPVPLDAVADRSGSASGSTE